MSILRDVLDLAGDRVNEIIARKHELPIHDASRVAQSIGSKKASVTRRAKFAIIATYEIARARAIAIRDQKAEVAGVKPGEIELGPIEPTNKDLRELWAVLNEEIEK